MPENPKITELINASATSALAGSKMAEGMRHLTQSVVADTGITKVVQANAEAALGGARWAAMADSLSRSVVSSAPLSQAMAGLTGSMANSSRITELINASATSALARYSWDQLADIGLAAVDPGDLDSPDSASPSSHSLTAEATLVAVFLGIILIVGLILAGAETTMADLATSTGKSAGFAVAAAEVLSNALPKVDRLLVYIGFYIAVAQRRPKSGPSAP